MRWTTKALIQRTLARLPFGRQAYTLGQSWVGGLRNYRIDGKLDQALRVRDALRTAGQTLTDRIALEIGTGWLPVAPMFYWLLGLRCCYAFDIDRLLSSRLTVAAAAQLIEIIEQPVRAPGDWRADLRSDRVEALRQLVRRGANHQEILVTCAIDYHAPADAAATGLPIGTVDVVFSSTVLEHVPTEDIGRLFREAYRILRPGAVMAHLIDPSDHYSHGDRSISGVNFLQFSPAQFARYNTPFLYQNRLRAPEYPPMVRDAGFEILLIDSRPNGKARDSLRELQVHPDFARFTPDELCSMSVRIVARRS